MRRMVIGLVVIGLLVGTTGVRPGFGQASSSDAPAPATEELGPAASFGWGMAAIGTNLGYIPAKLIWALGGSITALLAWGFSFGNSDAALGVLQPAVSGTWVVTPEMLRGEQPILFSGPSFEPSR